MLSVSVGVSVRLTECWGGDAVALPASAKQAPLAPATGGVERLEPDTLERCSGMDSQARR